MPRPTTETLERLSTLPDVYAEWAPNEKVALEVAAGVSLAGRRVLVTMKHVGLNVAADPLFTLAYTGVRGGLVILVADDPGIYSDDCVEFFFSTGAEDPLEYWHLTVNPLNARWDALTTNRTQMDVAAGFAWESATGSGEGTWAVEIRIPFRLLRPPGSAEPLTGAPVGATWRVNLTRQDKPGNENSSWSPVERGFLDNPSEFGRWYFPR